MTDMQRMASWQAHAQACPLCRQAKQATELCREGRRFWQVPEPAAPETALVAARLAGYALARSSAGTSVFVPMEKQRGGGAVTVSTAEGVVLRLPERDVEVYGEMRAAMQALVALAETMSFFLLATEEAEETMRGRESSEVALVVRQVTEGRGGVGATAEGLYESVELVARQLLYLADRLGQLVRADETTQKLMRALRVAGIEARGLCERFGAKRRLSATDGVRALVTSLRLLAVDLQGELERRLGT